MPSTDRRRRGQSGTSLIEALVASALLGIIGMVGLTAWDTAIMSARQAVRHSWAQCLARSELDAILAAPYSNGPYPTPDQSLMRVSLQVPIGGGTRNPGQEQRVVVSVLDPQSGDVVFQAAAIKLAALQGAKTMDDRVLSDITAGCPAP